MRQYGYKAPIITSDNHIFGGLNSTLDANEPILQPDGQWDAFLPVDEEQRKNGVETDACTSYGTLHAIATLMNKKGYN